MTRPTAIVLTAERRQILGLIADGRTDNAIGARMNLTRDQVRYRVLLLFRQLGARDRANAVHIGYQRGVLTVGDGQ